MCGVMLPNVVSSPTDHCFLLVKFRCRVVPYDADPPVLLSTPPFPSSTHTVHTLTPQASFYRSNLTFTVVDKPHGTDPETEAPAALVLLLAYVHVSEGQGQAGAGAGAGAGWAGSSWGRGGGTLPPHPGRQDTFGVQHTATVCDAHSLPHVLAGRYLKPYGVWQSVPSPKHVPGCSSCPTTVAGSFGVLLASPQPSSLGAAVRCCAGCTGPAAAPPWWPGHRLLPLAQGVRGRVRVSGPSQGRVMGQDACQRGAGRAAAVLPATVGSPQRWCVEERPACGGSGAVLQIAAAAGRDDHPQ